MQYATEEAAGELAQTGRRAPDDAPLVLVCTTDPANLYGAGASSTSNYSKAALRGCRGCPVIFSSSAPAGPILIIESHRQTIHRARLGLARPTSIPH